MTLDQAAALMGVSPRHTRRILAAYREKGAAAVAHGNRGRKPVNSTPQSVAADLVRLARTRYAGTNHTHLSELLSGARGHRQGHPAAHSGEGGAEQPAAEASHQSTGYAASACPGRVC